VIKHDELFFLCDPSGDVPMDESHGLGLYFHDCRYLDGYEVRLGETPPDRLGVDAAAGSWAVFELSNPDVKSADGRLLEKERVGITWERTLDSHRRTLHDSLCFTNFSVERALVPLTVRLRSGFESIFVVRGAQPKRRGTLHRPRWKGSTLEFRYDGADRIQRSLSVAFDPSPRNTDDTTARFELELDAQQSVTVSVSLQVAESPADRPNAHHSIGHEEVTRIRSLLQHSSDDWMRSAARVRSNDLELNRVLDRSLRDLHVLRTKLKGREYFAAGVPWYVTLFGRDSIITAIEALAFRPDRAEDTVRLLASYQGTREDAWRDEAPGKIMHELRVGEAAHLDEIPQTPYYGSVDATPLFLVLIAQHAAWTGRLDLFTSITPHVDAALRWMDDGMARIEGGYLAYATGSRKGLANQGWKDSGDAIVNQDCTLARPPIALVEVQGYVYLAKRGIAGLYRRAGNQERADTLVNQAEHLRERFERDFWADDLGTYALALQDDHEQAAVVSSNPGQALWTGIVSKDRAAQTAHRLIQDDMFTGWGIRTLSAHERRYNPIGYHNGTVWPHDNAIAVAGFRRYGCLDEATRVMSGLVDAATHFDHDRLPEVFAGFSRQQFAVPVHYPVACHPQAWAAGALPFMLESALGLTPDAFNHRLRIASPVLPDSVHTLSIEQLRVGEATARIVFARDGKGRVAVQDVNVDGHLDVTADGQ
jgi:glycogen debranching enzyme